MYQFNVFFLYMRVIALQKIIVAGKVITYVFSFPVTIEEARHYFQFFSRFIAVKIDYSPLYKVKDGKCFAYQFIDEDLFFLRD